MQLYKKPSRASQYFTTAVFLLVLTGCTEKREQPIIDCKIDVHQCLQLATKQTQITINTRAVIVEQNYKITLNSMQAIDSVFLRGENMNMGRIPIILSANNDAPPAKIESHNSTQLKTKSWTYQADMFLGMCAEPKMQWSINIQYKNGQTEQALFDAYWQAPH